VRLESARQSIEAVVGKPLISLPGCRDLNLVNKGAVGQVLERIIGLTNTSAPLDFEDGELKTNQVKWGGYPKETMGIMVISKITDKLLFPHTFEQSDLYYKIRNVLFVPVYYHNTDIPVYNWMFLPPLHANLDKPEFKDIKQRLKGDYEYIIKELRNRIDTRQDLYRQIDADFIQIRNKDSKDRSGHYHPIFSYKVGRYISDRNHGFYFKKEFMRFLQQQSPRYPYYGE